jgi:hypothetical protein
MTDVKWMIKGHEFAHCNCAYGCPCQFNALPTHGDCTAVVGMQIDQGYHGDTKLDGLKVVSILSWPEAIHLGHGQAQIIIDERANQALSTSISNSILLKRGSCTFSSVVEKT